MDWKKRDCLQCSRVSTQGQKYLILCTDSEGGRAGNWILRVFIVWWSAPQSTYIGEIEMKQGQCFCPLSWSVHCNFTGDGIVVKGGGSAPLTLTSQANFTLMMECTPERGRYHSVYSVVRTILKWKRVVTSAEARRMWNCRAAFTILAKMLLPDVGKSAVPRCLKMLLHATSNMPYKFLTLFIVNELRCLGVRCSDTAALTARRSTGHFTRKFAKNRVIILSLIVSFKGKLIKFISLSSKYSKFLPFSTWMKSVQSPNMLSANKVIEKNRNPYPYPYRSWIRCFGQKTIWRFCPFKTSTSTGVRNIIDLFLIVTVYLFGNTNKDKWNEYAH